MANFLQDMFQKNKLKDEISNIIAGMGVPGTWCKLANVGNALNVKGISYKEYGFTKLILFLKEFADCFEIRQIPSPKKGAPAIPEVRIKTDDVRQEQLKQNYNMTFVSEHDASTSEQSSSQNFRTKSTKGLFEWAYISDAQIEKLAEEIAVKETWYFGKECPDDIRKRYAILSQYLRHTFGKLKDEEKIAYAKEGGFAAFNTGLVDKKYEYIYALFGKNPVHNVQFWKLLDFCVAGIDKEGKQLIKYFNPLPSKADYFKGNMNYVIYEPTSGEFALDYEHILIENCRRLPAQFFEECCRPTNFTEIDGLNFSDAQKLDAQDLVSMKYFKSFQQKLKENESNFRNVKRALQAAVDVSKKRAEWNYKTAIPIYFPTHKKMSFLLPLSLLEEGTIDVALVVEKMDNGNYQGQTILPLDWAYSNSRLITKPESDWLNTYNISGSTEKECV